MNADHTPMILAVARLHRTLDHRGLVETVVKRGYRLARATVAETAG